MNPEQEIRPTKHAIEKWRKLTGSTKNDVRVSNRLVSIFRKAKEVEIKKEFRLKQLLNHGCNEARYFKTHNDMLMVVTKQADTIITIHDGAAMRWSE